MTLIEIMIAMVVGVIVMGAAMSFTITTFRGVESTNLREDVFRTGRFIGSSLERDAASAGVAIRSQTRFGTLLAQGDTLVIVSVPYDTCQSPPAASAAPGIAPVYSMPTGTATPATPGPGELRHLLRRRQGRGHWRHAAVRRRQHDPDERGQRAAVPQRHRRSGTWAADATRSPSRPATRSSCTRQAGRGRSRARRTCSSLPAATTFQKITPVMYYRDAQNRIIRSTGLTTGGAPIGEVVAENVLNWNVWLFFEDGDSARVADPTDGDATNDYDDLSSVKVMATLRERPRGPQHRNAGAAQVRVAVLAEEPGVRAEPVAARARKNGTGEPIADERTA